MEEILEAIKFVFWVLRHPEIWRQMCKLRSPEPDLEHSPDLESEIKEFRSLRWRVKGLLEQVEEGNVYDDALSKLATELDVLDVRPPAIRHERGQAHLKKELNYLLRCTKVPRDSLSLPLARQHFFTDPMGEHDWDRDAIGAIYDEFQEKADRRK